MLSLLRPRTIIDTDMSSGLVRRSCRPSAVTYGELFRDESPPRSGFSTLMTRAPRLASSSVA